MAKVSKTETEKAKTSKPAGKKNLSARRKAFAMEFLKDRNATQAAIRAGYPASSAKANAHRLMAVDGIRAIIDAKTEKIAAKIEVTKERIIAEYARIAFSDMRRVVKWGADMRAIHGKDGKIVGYTSGVGVINSDEIDDDTAASISEISESQSGGIKVKLHAKTDALHKLGVELGMFKTGLKVDPEDINPLIALVQAVQGSAMPIGAGSVGASVAPAAEAPVTLPDAPSTTAAQAPRLEQQDGPISPFLRPQGDI